jgi:RNA polymerase sigma-70 factor (ECF subfamily)
VEFFTFDKDYVDRLRKGDPSTEQHFVLYFEQLLRIKLRPRMLPHDQVEDLLQETFIRVIANLRSGTTDRHPERFAAFVNSICNNVLLEYLGLSSKNRPIEEALDAEDMPVTKLTTEHVRRILDGMSKLDRDLLRAIFVEQREKEAICQEMGVDQEYLRLLVRRAKLAFNTVHSAQLSLFAEPSESVTTKAPPGGTLYSIAESICSKKTMDEIVSPLLADMQFEYNEALSVGRNWKATWVRARGCWSFFTALGINRVVGMFVRIFLRFSSR